MICGDWEVYFLKKFAIKGMKGINKSSGKFFAINIFHTNGDLLSTNVDILNQEIETTQHYLSSFLLYIVKNLSSILMVYLPFD